MPFSGYYFGLGSWVNLRSGDYPDQRGRGYIAHLERGGEFREREFPIEQLWALKKTLRAISIPLGSSLAAIDGSDGLIRVYHSCGGWIDFFWSGVQQPEWKPLLEFIREVRQRFLRTTPSEILAVHLRNWIRSIEAIPLDALEARCPPPICCRPPGFRQTQRPHTR